MILLAANESEFFVLVMKVVNWTIDIFMLLWSFWYFRLLMIAGLIWIGFDIFEILADSNQYYQDDRGEYHRRS